MANKETKKVCRIEVLRSLEAFFVNCRNWHCRYGHSVSHCTIIHSNGCKMRIKYHTQEGHKLLN